MYHLQFRDSEGVWHVIEASRDLPHLTRRREAFEHNSGIARERVRIVDVDPPPAARAVPLAEREASGLVTVLTLALVLMLIAAIGLAVS